MNCERRVRIVADDRERVSGVINELGRRDDVELTVERMKLGDYLVEGNFLVERKTLHDLAVSVMDGRWFRQIAALASAASNQVEISAARSASRSRPVIVLEGTSGSDVHMSRESLQGALVTATVFLGIAVLRARDMVETARLLVTIGRQATRAATGALPRPGHRPKGRRSRQLFVLQGLPGIGASRAARLLDQFGSVGAVMSAPLEDLAAVRNIGADTAAKVRAILD